jgi:hypothetical protein
VTRQGVSVPVRASHCARATWPPCPGVAHPRCTACAQRPIKFDECGYHEVVRVSHWPRLPVKTPSSHVHPPLPPPPLPLRCCARQYQLCVWVAHAARSLQTGARPQHHMQRAVGLFQSPAAEVAGLRRSAARTFSTNGPAHSVPACRPALKSHGCTQHPTRTNTNRAALAAPHTDPTRMHTCPIGAGDSAQCTHAPGQIRVGAGMLSLRAAKRGGC